MSQNLLSVNWFSVLMGGGLFLYSMYRIWKMIDIVRRQSASASWTLTTAEILDCEVKEHSGSKGGKSYEPVICYRYSVMGEEYKNSISLGTALFRSWADQTLAEIGETLEVHYNPEKPKEHISSEETIRFMFALETLIFLVFGLFTLSWALTGSSSTSMVHGR